MTCTAWRKSEQFSHCHEISDATLEDDVTALKILFDTNTFIACEDISTLKLHANARVATDLKELAHRHGCELFLLAETEDDIRED